MDCAPKAVARGFNTGTELAHAAQLHHNAPPPKLIPPVSFNIQLPNQAETSTITKIQNIIEGVLYSPGSAMFAAGKDSVYNPYNLNLLIKQNLEWVLAQGAASFPDFPSDSVNIKPVFKHLKGSANTINQIPVWTGLPATPKAYPEKDWPKCVSVSIAKMDIDKSGDVYDCMEKGDSPSTTPAVYGLNNFIHISITDENIVFYKEYFFTGEDFARITEVNEGDVFILVGMHVTTKEIPPWTWMTFWWDPIPDSPELPSTPGMAAGKSILKKNTSNAQAVHHYALASGYRWTTYGKADADAGFQSVYPAVDVVTSKGINEKNAYDAVNAFNPYLEAGFGPRVFSNIVDSYQSYTKPSVKYKLKYGVETNCTSCHGVASYGDNSQGYNIDKLSTIYELRRKSDIITIDFAWSIKGEKLDITDCNNKGETKCRPYEKEPRAGGRAGGYVYVYVYK